MHLINVSDKELSTVMKRAIELRVMQRRTKENHHHQLQHFIAFIERNGFERNVFRKYKLYLAEERKDIVSHTKNQYLATARIVLRELAYEGILSSDITINTKGFQREKAHKRVGLSKSELRKVLRSLQNKCPTPKNNRLKAILFLMLLQGLRPSELSRMKVKNIFFGEKTATIMGKGRDSDEMIDLHPATIRALKQHLQTRSLSCRKNAKKISHSKNDYLFPGNRNWKGEVNRSMDRQRLAENIGNFFRELQIEKGTSALRKTFVVILIEAFGDLRKVQHFSRHKTLEMLQVYDDRIKEKKDLITYKKAFTYSMKL